MHWFVCLLHSNELPLKNLITKLDGLTDGAKSFSGPIGKSLENVCDLPIIKFKKMKDIDILKIPDHVFKKLSNDQRYLYRIVNAVISGNLPNGLEQLKIGELNHSRWLTTASRICRRKPLVVPKFKCHTQMVERAIKEVTRVSVKAVDHLTRNAMVKATLKNRAKYPRLDSRKDFNVIQLIN